MVPCDFAFILHVSVFPPDEAGRSLRVGIAKPHVSESSPALSTMWTTQLVFKKLRNS